MLGNNINISFWVLDNKAPLNEIVNLINELPKHKLNHLLWADGLVNTPQVYFSAAYTSTAIIVTFTVNEKETRTEVTNINGNVWEDSCVEFFIAIEGDSYYNFEANSAGIVLGSYGQSKNNRELLSNSHVSTIQTFTQKKLTSENSTWEIVLVIPYNVFIHHNINASLLKNKLCKGNFYKCGDKLLEPHFLSWSPIISEQPNFHLPQYFGNIIFT